MSNIKKDIADKVWEILIEHDVNGFQLLPMYLRSLEITKDSIIHSVVTTQIKELEYEKVMDYTINLLRRNGYEIPENLKEKYEECVEPFI